MGVCVSGTWREKQRGRETEKGWRGGGERERDREGENGEGRGGWSGKDRQTKDKNKTTRVKITQEE